MDGVGGKRAPAKRVWANAYHRDADGIWRYASDGTPVPDAVDLTRSCVYQVQRVGDQVLIPTRTTVLDHDVKRWLARIGAREEPHGHSRVASVPAVEWDRIDTWVGMSAPELQLWAVLCLQDVSALTGYSPSTMRVYRSRGLLVGPQRTIARTPLWSRPVVERWSVAYATAAATAAAARLEAADDEPL